MKLLMPACFIFAAAMPPNPAPIMTTLGVAAGAEQLLRTGPHPGPFAVSPTSGRSVPTALLPMPAEDTTSPPRPPVASTLSRWVTAITRFS